MPSREGSPNKNKQFLLNRLQDMYGDDFDPVMKMAENAHKMQQLVDMAEDKFTARKNCVDAWDKIAVYVTPKLKAVEHSGDITHKPHEAWLDIINGED